MKTYVVTATRNDGWWAIHADVPGTIVWTQARRLDQVDETVREAIALALDVPADSFALDIRPQVDADLRQAIEDLHSLADAADAAQTAASNSRRLVAKKLKSRGYTVRDAGKLMGLSSQRVSQLLGE